MKKIILSLVLILINPLGSMTQCVTNVQDPMVIHPGELHPAPKLLRLGSPRLVRASWYGGKYAGCPTSNGDSFNPSLLTAAHRTFPMGTILRVTNPRTGLAVVVRINDRGPFVKGRDLDLSQAAAKAIGLTGVAIVKIEKYESVSGL